VHIAIDDCTRLAYAEVLADEKATTAIAFLRRAVAFFSSYGITVQRLLTDNGSPLPVNHPRDRLPRPSHPPPAHPPHRPQTNGKAERFIRTLLSGWAYGAIDRTSTERTAAPDGWLFRYNHHRNHSAIGRQPPIARLNEQNNALGNYS
jgi:transposase InsO family protein